MAPIKNVAALLLSAVAGAEAQNWDHSLFTTSPPVYPSPNMTGVDAASLSGWSAAMAKAEAFVSNLTLEEKVSLLTGAPGPCVGNIAPIARVGFKGLCLQDGPLAIRWATHASAFPAGLTAATSWDRNLIRLRGQYLGEEFRGKGAEVFLGPVAGPLGRSGKAGRNWEGFSPDPYLTGVAMEETIIGVQGTGVQAVAKHWLANEQETQRNPVEAFNSSVNPNTNQVMSVSENVEDRTIHELYSWPFANAVRAGVASVMCSYNRVNASYACQNSKLLNGILKTELGFQGYVMSDWMGTHSGVASVEAGLDMTMPGAWNWQPLVDGVPSWFGGNLTKAVQNGTVAESRVDDMAKRVMTPYYLLGQDEGFPGKDAAGGEYPAINDFAPLDTWYDSYKSAGALNDEVDVNVRGNHSTFIRKMGAEAIVLLKNTNNVLPLKAPKYLGVFGNAASEDTNGNYYRDQEFEFGALAAGGGSGTVRFADMVTPLEALKNQAREDGTLLQFILNNTMLSTATGNFAKIISPQPEVCLVFLKTWASEGADRTSLNVDWDGDEVVNQVAANCSNTVVITTSGGLTLMPWADNENVTAILAAHFPGEQIGNSIVDVLYGKVNPSGRLPYTIAHEADDYDFANITTEVADTTDTDAWQSDFTERLLIDYRYFDYHNISVQYEFGYGLSYSTFALSGLTVTPVSNSTSIAGVPATADITPGGNPALWDTVYKVTVTVENTGNVTGSAVPQLYIGIPGGDATPLKQLRGFEKVALTGGQKQEVTFELMRRDISIWDVNAQEWSVPSGKFGVYAGFSSRDIKLTGSFTV